MFTRTSAVLLHRTLWLLFFVQAIVSFTVGLPYSYAVSWLPLIAAVAVGIALARHTGKQAGAAARPPVEVDPPVAGRWTALNSPADRTPSHGTHQYGQTYAIDILAEAEEGERPRPSFAWLWPVARRSEDFPAFGAPLFAVADATVVHAEDGQRDHLSRNSLPAFLYLLVFEGVARVLAGARRIVGNHLILDLGNGTYAVYAHLRRGSLTVRAGDRVTAGQRLARCGNSGNSTEPHVHFHLMNGPDLDTARGVPFTWRGVGVPKNEETFEAIPGSARPAA
ncbi:M23 family metallopeptidase [Streptomyces sp. WAC08241]|uniref:M23 family metallopeptidase n=1 Tax=Streptomyces sp. WAC08241 TaxID=2487421 RepID=UPI000F79A345|nr:M23 family metallopeptidase [Streptomyces sp. WAC08241]RSS43563.1 M23 family metallopeptidase [Streptomyces sp. WAC08241]